MVMLVRITPRANSNVCIYLTLTTSFFNQLNHWILLFSATMLLRTASSFSLLNLNAIATATATANADHVLPLINSSSSSAIRCSHAKSFVPSASKGSNNRPVTGVVFEPFEEVKKELDLVPTLPEASLARQKYTHESEAVINEQIKWVRFYLFLLQN